MANVKPKKHLGQHFLEDMQIADDIVNAMTQYGGYKEIYEIGPGTGVLTTRLLNKDDIKTTVVEIDTESVDYLRDVVGLPEDQIIGGDFLKLDFDKIAPHPVGLIGNFPYNISTQIYFKVLEHKDQITECVGMIQKEVAERICCKTGGRTAGILTILVQAFYDVDYLFTVPPTVFNPPPKVDSAVISLKRNDRKTLPCDEKLFFKVVKQAFSTRRKTLRNAMKPFGLPADFLKKDIFSLRAEALSVDDFIQLTVEIEEIRKS
ncbi:16S rRNA (adenine(1518)-N(6)/adenine(1519)-N(6))-dimethyltransferase RsmA [Flammeovirga yaeyamensis]|uniref:Ribosomal RNA small subunit methyltransferase A n=1 Tax=Flammeovirga yaeyamensis TaxID=367791 RepID=A0AAX1N2W9_9BACT|nr:16S rRNA (adenine(1518)-N(6)/adenine(1519)-N(6))-dimethyltransferase RsmA [Flammeovirga yaeyamensis]MBB3696296.1 16S rRNA (adenine1518-N6/adenine1519-N6)-dimethyltransferase [Flammeovirga yaeyamensis]NMF34975.1 16S rRNA (adenine(1518)-N(6)/adenine(1519)-N(6))-dimethyltransferase RsmA [Flammeovirga yaeyamensis]QWG00198.1 16S rRNA (adenine(1518)-N(6)/adenine(1519)-N(6))-dimethyltransferase RsmA [Flammeovirga yaeyamensis]